eukprot:196186_1
MASLNPSQHLESNIIPSNGHLSSSEPDLHLHLDQSRTATRIMKGSTTKLKSMRRKKSRTNFLNKQRAKRGNINLDVHAQRTNDKDVSDTKSGQDIRMRLEEKEKEYDGDDGYAHTEPLEAKAIADKAVIRKIYDSSIVHVLTHRAEDEAALCYVENFVQYRHRNKPLIIDLSSVENMLRVIVQ